ncbi:hypothetical protein IJH46_00845 [Candidatus Saccharibacteria bacterium]|nr:hypothetical protein [Candidatus Saccharibacteria bacterium]
MKTKTKLVLREVAILAFVALVGTFFCYAKPVFAESCGGVNTSLINCSSENGQGEPIFELLAIVLNILTYGVAAAGVLGIVISGIQYMTASGNEAQMTKAKNRIVQVVIGLLCYGLLWTFLEWLIPGGVL